MLRVKGEALPTAGAAGCGACAARAFLTSGLPRIVCRATSSSLKAGSLHKQPTARTPLTQVACCLCHIHVRPHLGRCTSHIKPCMQTKSANATAGEPCHTGRTLRFCST